MYMGQKTVPVAGTDKLPMDFVKATRYVGDDQVTMRRINLCACVQRRVCSPAYRGSLQTWPSGTYPRAALDANGP